MRFIKHHQIPTRRVQEALDARWALQGVDAGDQSVVLGEGVGLAVGDVTLGAEHSKSRLNTSFSSRCQLFTRPAGTTISARVSSPRLASSRRMSAVSMVLPRPTSSAMR
ncbi:hypothetical protein D9M68_948510 [compost metagenome]